VCDDITIRAHSRHTLRRLKPRWPAPHLAFMGPTARLRRTAAHICGASAPTRSSASAVAGRRRRSCDAVAPSCGALAAAAVEGEAPAVASSEAGLTQEEIDAFDRDGYLLVKGAATTEQTARVQRAMHHQLGMVSHPPRCHQPRRGQRLDVRPACCWQAPDEPDGWYRTPPHANPSPFQHIAFFGTPHDTAAAAPHSEDEAAAWEIAQNPRVHSAFASLWGTERLWASVEMGSFKPPWRHGLPKYDAICHAGVQPWFSLGDALPMVRAYTLDIKRALGACID
jgi:hypothetical protein